VRLQTLRGIAVPYSHELERERTRPASSDSSNRRGRWPGPSPQHHGAGRLHPTMVQRPEKPLPNPRRRRPLLRATWRPRHPHRLIRRERDDSEKTRDDAPQRGGYKSHRSRRLYGLKSSTRRQFYSNRTMTTFTSPKIEYLTRRTKRGKRTSSKIFFPVSLMDS